MGVPIHPSDFQTVEGFYEPEAAGLLFALDPILLALLLILGAILFGLGWLWGDQRRQPDDPCEAIYTVIRKASDAALAARRDQVVDRARALQAAIHDRLGDVIALTGGFARPLADLTRALGAHGPADHPHPEAARTSIESLVINAETVTVNGHSAAPDEAHGHGHDDGGHHDGGHHDGPHGAATLSPRAQVDALRAAIHAFSDHWADKPRRLAELRKARLQLIRPVPLPKPAGAH